MARESARNLKKQIVSGANMLVMANVSYWPITIFSALQYGGYQGIADIEKSALFDLEEETDYPVALKVRAVLL